jgi:GNAT superfamily N-acetyltransferase
MRPQWFFVNLIFWGFSFPPERWRVSNFQNRGLGSAMIEFLISYGRSKSVKRIEGYVKPPDDKANRDLLNWYKRRGFTAEMGNERTAWIAKVSLSVKY